MFFVHLLFSVLESQISLHDEEFPCSSLHDEEGDKLYIRFGGNMVKSRRDTLLESSLLEVTQYMMVQSANNSDKSSVMRLEVRHTERYNLVMNLMGKIR